jgi:hypothetical protein
MDEHQIKAFWSKIDVRDSNKECWPWLGAKTPTGYGNLAINGKYLKAHRVAWELCNFEIPKGYVVMHVCDNPSCCNPNHLVLGTHKANTTDMVLKNRGGFHKNRAKGERNYNAKLTAEAVKEIRRDYAAGKATQYDLADRFGVTQTAISCVLKNKTWRHVA